MRDVWRGTLAIEGLPLSERDLTTLALDLAVRGTVAWVATDRGLFRMDTQNPLGVRRWSLTNGLPDDRVLSVAAVAGGAAGMRVCPLRGERCGENDSH